MCKMYAFLRMTSPIRLIRSIFDWLAFFSKTSKKTRLSGKKKWTLLLTSYTCTYSVCVWLIDSSLPMTYCFQCCKGKHITSLSLIHTSTAVTGTLPTHFHRPWTRSRYVYYVNCAGWGTNPYSKALSQLYQKVKLQKSVEMHNSETHGLSSHIHRQMQITSNEKQEVLDSAFCPRTSCSKLPITASTTCSIAVSWKTWSSALQ